MFSQCLTFFLSWLLHLACQNMGTKTLEQSKYSTDSEPSPAASWNSGTLTSMVSFDLSGLLITIWVFTQLIWIIKLSFDCPKIGLLYISLIGWTFLPLYMSLKIEGLTDCNFIFRAQNTTIMNILNLQVTSMNILNQ